MSAAPSLLTAKQAAELIGCHTDTVNRLRKAGKLPARLHGTRTYRYRRVDVEALTTAAVPVPGDYRGMAALFRRLADLIESGQV
jgi:excisionase family DNA binding protein